MEELTKRFYRIGDVAEILGIPASTLRYWEKEFTIIKPTRSAKNIRLYTPKDIETIKMIYYLVKEKGLKLDAAQAMIRRNREGVSKRFEVVERLKRVRDHSTTRKATAACCTLRKSSSCSRLQSFLYAPRGMGIARPKPPGCVSRSLTIALRRAGHRSSRRQSRQGPLEQVLPVPELRRAHLEQEQAPEQPTAHRARPSRH